MFKHHRRSSRSILPIRQVDPIVRLWLLRLLVPLRGHRGFIEQTFLENDDLGELLGLGHWIDPEDREFDAQKVRQELRKLHADAETTLGKAVVAKCLVRNIDRLSKLVDLSAVDCRILEFVVLLHNESILDTAADYLGQLSSVKVCRVLSIVLDLPLRDVRQALGPNSVLARSGLVTVSRSGESWLRSKLESLSDSFADHICSSDADPVSLLRDTVALSPPATLTMTDFGYLHHETAVLRPYLADSIASARAGVNILIYGNPGTGKTQLVRVIAEILGCELFEVSSEDEEGDPVKGERRLRAYRAAQSFLARRKALILFDEAEDVFGSGDYWWSESIAQSRKAWLNRMLEASPVPTLWLSNSASGIDPAFVRRFDIVMDVPVPPQLQRQKVIRDTCVGFLDEQAMQRVAASEHLAPAVVTRAAGVVQSIGKQLSGEDGVSAAFELLVNKTLETQGHPRIPRYDPNRLPANYDPGFIQADTDISQIAEGLQRTKAGRLCFYGPPGTGKTAYARWIAGQLEVPLIIKRASDLKSMWVGQSEKNIAAAFREAESSGAVLLMDEVDSFLLDRRGAWLSWEVSEVNEMLTQIESCPGVFIASTNLMEGLDQAALRRFDLKIRFDYLDPDRAWGLFTSYCRALGLAEPEFSLRPLLTSLKNLAPGDFAAVARRHRFHPIESAQALFAALEAECGLKEEVHHAIGFVH